MICSDRTFVSSDSVVLGFIYCERDGSNSVIVLGFMYCTWDELYVVSGVAWQRHAVGVGESHQTGGDL